MRWLALLVGCAALAVLVAVGQARAQGTLGAPTISSVSTDRNSLEISWSAPSSDGGSTIVAYDLRYIRNDAMDKADANWTIEEVWTTGGGTLEYELKDLPDGTKYDLQLRADNGTDGPWTATREATTRDHSGSRSGATLLDLGSSVPGSLDPADDEDFFRIVLTSETDLWVYASGSDDTVGEVQRSNGTVVASNDDGILLDGRLNFSIRAAELGAGTYYVRVTSFDARETASYTIHARAATDPGDTVDTATTVTLDSMTPGRIAPFGGTSGDADYFKLELGSATDVWVTAIGDIDTYGVLLSVDETTMVETVLEEQDDSELLGNRAGFMFRRALAAGTYYIKVTGYQPDDTGPYTLFVRTATEPGNTLATARPMVLRVPETGNISSASDEDYFSLTLDEEMYLFMYALGFGDDPLSLTPTVFDDTDTAVDGLYVTPGDDHQLSFTLWGKLAAGTYRIKIAPSSGGTGTYLFQVLVSTYGRTEERCTGLTTTQSDPWYGCAWHLNNTNQFPDGAGQDINVEEVWDTTMGAGINVAVADDGLHYAHEDLAPNVITARNHDYFGSDVFDPLETHGTLVAGIIAARDNDLGVRGVAPRASIYAYNVIAQGEPEDVNAADAMTRNKSDTAVSNNSWGPPRTIGDAPALWEQAIVDGVTNGYGGKGVFYVFAAGNDDPTGHDSNLDEYANHFGVTAVCAVNHNDVRTAYSERGSNLWVCAPSGDGTRGLPGIATTRNADRYTSSFSGTSASAPIVSGVAALLRAVNSDLTWRDVKLILAASARRNDPSNSTWQQGARKYDATGDSTSQRYRFSHEYGFGTVDAGAAVALAQNWTELLPELREIEVESGDLDLAIPDAPTSGSSTRVTTSLTVDSYVGFVEFVEVNAEFDHPSFRDILMFLVSPSGTRSRIVFAARTTLFRSDGTTTKLLHPLTESFRFGSARHLGENATGTWTLRITDEFGDDVGTLKSWSLKIYGHGFTAGVPLVTTPTPVNQALAVAWTAPVDTGDPDAEITAYDLRYISDGDLTDGTPWSLVRNVWRTGGGDLRYVIRNLANDMEYAVQVRAVTSEGDGRWSETLSGKPASGNTEPKFPGVETGERSVDENTLAGRNIGDPVAARDDDRDALTYTLGGGLDSYFDIVAGTGQLRTRELLNHEGRDSYTGTIMVSDSKNAAGEPDTEFDAAMVVTITIDDVDEPPEIVGDASHDLPEGSNRFVGVYSATDPEGDTVGLSLKGRDAGDFEFSNGLLDFSGDPDYEAAASHLVTFEATDGRLTSTLDVTVNVENVEEPGTVTLPAQPQAGTPFTASLTDPDGLRSSPVWTWERSPNGFTNWSTIDGETSTTYTPRTTDVTEYLRATASYDDGHGVGKSATATSGEAVRAAPVTNRPPTFPPTETGQRSVFENTPSGRSIGAPVEATDEDVLDTLTYSIDRTGATFFDIDSGSGQLSTKAALDRERRASYRLTVTATDPSLRSASVAVTVAVDDIDEDPVITGDSVVGFREGGTASVARYTAMDPERAAITWSLTGLDASLFSITNGTLAFLAPPDFDMPGDVGGDNEYEVTVMASDPAGNRDLIVVTVRVTEETTDPVIVRPVISPGIGFGGGGGGGPTPSVVDFEWNVERDIEDLASGHDKATGMWSDDVTLWLLHNGDGADDAIYAYSLQTGERVEALEFALHESNRAPRGLWSDRVTAWVSDSGQERLFAYDVETGERAEEREIVLADGNSDARGIWSDGITVWVLDSGREPLLFGYDLESGEWVAEYALDAANGDPHGIFSDGVTIWVTDHGAKRIFAYRFPSLEGEEETDETPSLERVGDEDFRLLGRASNNSPRGIWSDGEVMYVADQSDDRVYTYNLPDDADARLASLTLTDLDIGEFASRRTEYEAAVPPDVTETTVEAAAVQRGATVALAPDDANEESEGHQAEVADGVEVTVTVTSRDGSREKVYRVRIGEAPGIATADATAADEGTADVTMADDDTPDTTTLDEGPADDCLGGLVAARFSLVTYQGGAVADLDACARHLGVTSLYVAMGSAWVSYIVDAPAFVNRPFSALFADGVPPLTPMIAQRLPLPSGGSP